MNKNGIVGKLQVNRETLRQISGLEATNVAAGALPETTDVCKSQLGKCTSGSGSHYRRCTGTYRYCW